MNRIYKVFLWRYFFVISLIFLPVYLFLLNSFEHKKFSEIVDYQLEHDAIYGTALNQNTFSYKLELLKRRNPEIIALGSSRVMQFRKEYFSVPFANAGASMNHLSEGIEFLEKLLPQSKPKIILLGLDFWWFNNRYIDPGKFPYHKNDGKKLTYLKVFKPFSYIFEGKLKINSVVHIMQEYLYNDITSHENLGLSALETSDGFRKDGSYLHAKTVFGLTASIDENFKHTFSMIDRGGDRFIYGDSISIDRILKLQKIVNLCKKNKIELILFIPPVAPTVVKKINEKEEKYIHLDELKYYLTNLSLEHYDYHLLNRLDTNDCEFIDGFHGGDVTYARILLDMYHKKSSLAHKLDIKVIEKAITTYNNKSLVMFHSNKYKKYEKDFLNLGCQK